MLKKLSLFAIFLVATGCDANLEPESIDITGRWYSCDGKASTTIELYENKLARIPVINCPDKFALKQQRWQILHGNRLELSAACEVFGLGTSLTLETGVIMNIEEITKHKIEINGTETFIGNVITKRPGKVTFRRECDPDFLGF